MAAAVKPKKTCLAPEYQIVFPVNSVIAEPIKNKPIALSNALTNTAAIPLKKKNGITGIIVLFFVINLF